jgi:hypothetical protein
VIDRIRRHPATLFGPLTTMLVVLLACAHIFARQASAPSVTFFPLSAHPGEVVRADVEGSAQARPPKATMFGRAIAFAYVPDRQTWSGLIGIDLATKPGAYVFRLEAGDRPASSRTLRVLRKAFTVRRLRVAPGFVDPSPDEIDRIGRERKTIEDIFDRVTPRRWRNAFVLPVDGTPTSNFGTRSVYNGQPRAPHAGIDFSGAPGTPIRAANHGTIALAEPLYFTGNTIIIDHGEGLLSLFAHLSELRVKRDDAVTPETIVGLVGATGRVTGPHLHWSVRIQGARVDPLSLVAATQ